MPIGMDVERLRIARALALKLEALPKTGGIALQVFVDAGGVVSYIGPSQGYRARLHGFTATGTGSGAWAVGNWIAQVKRKTEELA